MPGDYATQLATLGYTQQWLDYGLLTPTLLATHYAAFEAGDDRHPEHYRYGAFRHYLNNHTRLTDQELANYLTLTLAEQDSMMGGTAAKDLFTEISLTDQQFAELCRRLGEFPGDWTTAIRSRQQLLRRLATTRLDARLFAECLTEGDGVVQKELLALADAAQLAELAANGKTRSIRNAAALRLKSY